MTATLVAFVGLAAFAKSAEAGKPVGPDVGNPVASVWFAGPPYKPPTIVVDGDTKRYNKVITEELSFYYYLKSRKPENSKSFQYGTIEIEYHRKRVSGVQSGETVEFELPVQDLRTWKNSDLRVSPEKLCNDELSYKSGAERRKFLKKGGTIWRHSAYKIGGSALWVMKRRKGLSVDFYERTFRAPAYLIGVYVECKGLERPRGTKTTSTKAFPGANEGERNRAKPTLENVSLKISPMSLKRVGRYLCPTQLRLNGRVDVRREFTGHSIFQGPQWLSRKTAIAFQKAGGRNIVATYPIDWNRGVGESLSAGSNGKRKSQTITFKMNVSGRSNQLIGNTSKTIKIICKKPKDNPGGSNDLSSGPTQTPEIFAKKLTGDFSFIDNDGKRCPRTVKALINFELNENKPVRYALDCQSGRYSGFARAIAKDGKYVAPAAVNLELPNGTEGKARLTCALKTNAPYKAKIHTVKGRTFNCVNPNSESGAGGLNTSGRNTTSDSSQSDPDRPEKRLVCKGGKTRGAKCSCGSKLKLVKLDERTFKCVAKPVRVNPKPKKAVQKILCQGGKLKNRKCTCSSGKNLKKLRKNSFKCVANPVRANPKPKKAVQKILCQAGKLKNRKCVCGSGKNLKKLRKNSFKCVAKPVQKTTKPAKKIKIMCKGGKIKNGRCRCGANRKLNTLGPARFVCVKKK